MTIRWQQMSFGRRGASGAAAQDASTIGENLAHRAQISTEMEAPAPPPLPHSPEHVARLGAAREAFDGARLEALRARAATLVAPATAPEEHDEDDDEEDDAYDEESDPDAARFDEDVVDGRSRLELLREAAKLASESSEPSELDAVVDDEAVHFLGPEDGTRGHLGLAGRGPELARDLAHDGDAIAGESRADRLRRGWGSFHNRVRNRWLRLRGVTEGGPSIAQPEDAFTPLDRGGPWTVHTDGEMIRHRAQHGAAMTNVNRVDRVWYGDTKEPGAGGRMGFFKPEPGPGQSTADGTDNFERGGNRYRLAARAVMSSAIDKALGTNVISDESFAEHLNWATGKHEMGNFSAGVDGAPMRGGYVDESRSSGTTTTVVQGLNTSVPLRSEETQRGLSNLQVVDWLTAQSDRHGGNVFITKDGVVKGIDNDLAFFDAKDATGGFNRGLPPVVHRKTADAVLAMKEEDLRKILDDAVPPSERLTRGGEQVTNEMDAAIARLRALQEHIETNRATVVVDTFDDATFDRMRAKRESGKDSTYLGAFASMAEGLKEGPMVTPVRKYDEDGNVLSTVNNELLLDDPGADLSSWAVGFRSGDDTSGSATDAISGQAREGASEGGASNGRGRGRGRAQSASEPRVPNDAGRGRAHTFDSAGEGDRGTKGGASDQGSSSASSDAGLGGSNRSGSAETKGDEQRLGPGGESGLGEATAYGRFITAFGRNPEAGFKAWKAQWERAVHQRAAVAVAQQARTAAEGTLAEQAQQRLTDVLESSAPEEDAAPVQQELAGPTRGAQLRDGARAATRALGRNARAVLDAARDAASRAAAAARGAHRGRRPVAGDAVASADEGPTVLTDEQLVTQKTTVSQAAGAQTNQNRVDRVVYDRPIGNSGRTGGFFKPNSPESPIQQEATRSVLSSRLDQELGFDVLSTEVFAEHNEWRSGASEFGVVSVSVADEQNRSRALMESKARPDEHGGRYIERNMHTGVDPRNPRFQEGMAKLQTLDWLTAQMDRHNGNIFVDKDGNVRGIDNDWAFEEHTRDRLREKNRGLPPQVPADTAATLRDLTPARLRELLTSGLPPGRGLTEMELASAERRLAMLKAHLDKPGVVVERFDDATYAAALDAKKVTQEGRVDDDGGRYDVDVERAATYLGEFVDLTQEVSRGERDGEDGVRWAQDAAFDPGSWDASASSAPAEDARPTIEGSPQSQWQSATPGAWNPNEGWKRGLIGPAKAQTGVEANVRKGTTTSESRGTTTTAAAERVGYALKRRNHAGTSLRSSENKKTPSRGTKKRASTTSHKRRK